MALRIRQCLLSPRNGVEVVTAFGLEMDARAHLSVGFKNFFDNVNKLGLKDALRLRDAPFDEGEASIDD